MTPPTSNPSAMSQELSEEKLINRLRDADSILRFGTAVNSGDNRFAHISNANAKLVLEAVDAALLALLSAQRKNEELVKALRNIVGVVSYSVDTSINERGWNPRSIDVSGSEYIGERARQALSISEEK